MMELLSDNHTWIFSGIGVAALTATGASMRYAFLAARNRILIPTLPADRRRSAEKILLGHWAGQTVETERSSGERSTYDVAWYFYKKRGMILCDSPAKRIVDGQPVIDDYHLVVRILDNRFFMIEFCNKDDNSLNFGSEILQLHDNNREFSGRFVAYAPDHKDIISGTIYGKRRP